ncbi:MAG: NADH-quinone oxidoreductase subunit L, partial [Candidatus Bipolaricaulota bacterium]|nr:NADH-quinone oxidoreductase subunit L [Candidatus Bipolaricaulota bacterium]
MPWEAAWLIPLLPFGAAFIIAVWGRKLPEGGGWVAVGTGAIVLSISLPIATQALVSEESFHQSFPWFRAGTLELHVGLYIDKLAALMLLVVSSIGFFIFVYSIAYMHAEGPRRPRYYAEIMLFLGSMLGLVLADNY